MNRSLNLESLEQLGWRFGLETIQDLLLELGHPGSSLRVVHVAGSNGKGSTCAYVASYLKACGYKVGLYTSPHLCDIRERFRINGTWIPMHDFERHSRKVLQACLKVKKKLGHLPTHFEALTAIAFCWFEEQKVDWVVLEVGLGGRLDATNVISTPAVSLITPVGLEHQNILGKTLKAIALEKAGILKEGCLAATWQRHPEALQAIERSALEKGAKISVGGRDFKFSRTSWGFKWQGGGIRENFKLPGLPDHQVGNASLAIAGIQCLASQGVPFEPRLVQRSFAAMRWPGRLEVLRHKPLVILDGAHNPDAAKALADAIRKKYPGKKWIILNGFLKDKDYTSSIRYLSPFCALSLVTEPPSERKESGVVLLRAWEKAGARSLVVPEWEKALELALRKIRSSKGGLGLLITGSLYLGGACRKALLGLKGLEKI